MNDDHGHDDHGPDESGQQPRGLAALAYSGLVVVGLAAVTLAGVTGADAAPRLGALEPAAQSAGSGTPAHSTRAASRKLARQLIKEAVLPPGAAQLHLSTLPKVLHGLGDGSASYHKIDIFKVFWDREVLKNAYSYVNKHHPKGWVRESSGSSYRLVHGKKHYFDRQVTYQPSRTPAGYDQIDLQLSVLRHHGHSWIRADLMVIWYPPRSAAEELLASHFRSVTARLYRNNEKPHHLRRTFKQRAIIERLSKVLNSAEASPGTPFISCPLIDITYTLTFAPVKHQGKVTVQIDGCYSMSIKVGQHRQPALVDNGRVEGILDHLFHVHPFLVPGHHPIPLPVSGLHPVRPVSPAHPDLPDSEPVQP
jgi:hypothetical protein